MLRTNISLIYIHWIQYNTIIRCVFMVPLIPGSQLKKKISNSEVLFWVSLNSQLLLWWVYILTSNSQMIIESSKFPTDIYLCKIHGMHPCKYKF